MKDRIWESENFGVHTQLSELKIEASIHLYFLGIYQNTNSGLRVHKKNETKKVNRSFSKTDSTQRDASTS